MIGKFIPIYRDLFVQRKPFMVTRNLNFNKKNKK
jgi:hypothetical protein